MVASLGKQVREAMRGPGQVNAQGALDAIQWQRLDDASFRDSDIKELMFHSKYQFNVLEKIDFTLFRNYQIKD